jgi:hypothetical protein
VAAGYELRGRGYVLRSYGFDCDKCRRMGWSDIGDECVEGDGPSDAVSDGLAQIAGVALERTGALPSGEVLLNAFVRALNLDGTRAPFHSESRRVEAILVSHAGAEVRLDGAGAEAWAVADWYETLEAVAEEYIGSFARPPHLRELLHYLSGRLGGERYSEKDFRQFLSDLAPWKLKEAKVVLSTQRKSRDRSPAPSSEPLPQASRGRVTHPKFGEGVVLVKDGERLTVQFGSDRRVVLRSFVSWLP